MQSAEIAVNTAVRSGRLVVRKHRRCCPTDSDFLGGGGNGLDVFNEHLAYYRPMVAAVALGAAARIYDEAEVDLWHRLSKGLIRRPLDPTLELLACTRYEIECQLHYALRLHNIQKAEHAVFRSLAVKACAVDRALEAGERLERVLGARGFRARTRR